MLCLDLQSFQENMEKAFLVVLFGLGHGFFVYQYECVDQSMIMSLDGAMLDISIFL